MEGFHYYSISYLYTKNVPPSPRLNYCDNFVFYLHVFIRVPVIWARIIFYSQFLVCKFLFFADKEGKFISITNRYITISCMNEKITMHP